MLNIEQEIPYNSTTRTGGEERYEEWNEQELGLALHDSELELELE